MEDIKSSEGNVGEQPNLSPEQVIATTGLQKVEERGERDNVALRVMQRAGAGAVKSEHMASCGSCAACSQGY